MFKSSTSFIGLPASPFMFIIYNFPVIIPIIKSKPVFNEFFFVWNVLRSTKVKHHLISYVILGPFISLLLNFIYIFIIKIFKLLFFYLGEKLYIFLFF